MVKEKGIDQCGIKIELSDIDMSKLLRHDEVDNSACIQFIDPFGELQYIEITLKPPQHSHEEELKQESAVEFQIDFEEDQLTGVLKESEPQIFNNAENKEAKQAPKEDHSAPKKFYFGVHINDSEKFCYQILHNISLLSPIDPTHKTYLEEDTDTSDGEDDALAPNASLDSYIESEFVSIPLENDDFRFATDERLLGPPPLLQESSILNSVTMRLELIRNHLPSTYKCRPWTLLFSTASDGTSMKTFYRRNKDWLATVIVIKDTNGNVFGGYASSTWAPHESYFGTGESFLFKLYPTPDVYLWNFSSNSHFMLAKNNHIEMGSGYLVFFDFGSLLLTLIY